MGTIRFLALGAGQDVGRSCVVVTLGGRTVMFDCGMHMGFNDERRFPDFTLLSATAAPLETVVDCVIVTHFHLDHCGALPYLTEMCGYSGPVFMTHPTKALCPILLEDYRKITVERKGETNFFTQTMIRDALRKVIPLKVHESYFVGADLEIRPYYAGHVLGAAMFYVRVGNESVVYTGDYNMTPDRHLGGAEVEMGLRPDVLITESTYATTLRDSKRARERDFLRNVHQCVAGGGKVLIPVFALGRVQELCILLEAYWERMDLAHVPVYFSAGMAETANEYYRVYIDWTNERLQSEYPVRNLFDFKHVRPFEKHFAEIPGPMVLFSSPGMLHSGMSLEIFKKWCGEESNLLIIPGFCVSGTVGAKILSGQRRIEMEDGGVVTVKMQVKNMSFSAHADARGIMQMIRTCRPRNVVLVHGEAGKMSVLKAQIVRELGISCYDPPNGELVHIESGWEVPVRLDPRLVGDVRAEIEQAQSYLDEEGVEAAVQARSADTLNTSGLLQWERADAAKEIPPMLHSIQPTGSLVFSSSVAILPVAKTAAAETERLLAHLRRLPALGEPHSYLAVVLVGGDREGGRIKIRSFSIEVCMDQPANGAKLLLEWDDCDTDLAKHLIASLGDFYR